MTISGGEEAIQLIATKEKVRYIASEYLYHMDCPAFGMFHTFTFAGLPSEVRMPHIDCNYGSYRTRPSAEKTGVVNTACFREGSCCFTEDTYLSTCLTSNITVLTSIKGQYMTQQWKKHTHGLQSKWPHPYEDMPIPHEDSSSDTRAAKPTFSAVLKMPGPAAACKDPQKRNSRRRRDHEDDSDPDDPPYQPERSARVLATRGKTLLRRSTRTTLTRSAQDAAPTQGGSRQAVWAVPSNAVLSPTLVYCTQACLLGLKRGGKKDPNCPNADLHRRQDVADGDSVDAERHPISAKELRERLVQQLAEDMDRNCYSLEPYGMFGAIGALFKVALSEFGYCFVGKGVQRAHRKRLQKETVAYGLLEQCQGRLVPVNLGIIRLVDEYWTMCGAHISHMMLMSFAGQSLWHHGRQTGNYELYRLEMMRTLEEIKPYGVLHGDENNNNMVWNEELQRVMVIDFDHSVVLQQRPDKRGRASEDGNARGPKRAKELIEGIDSGMDLHEALI